jgi:hypothetical protein
MFENFIFLMNRYSFKNDFMLYTNINLVQVNFFYKKCIVLFIFSFYFKLLIINVAFQY